MGGGLEGLGVWGFRSLNAGGPRPGVAAGGGADATGRADAQGRVPPAMGKADATGRVPPVAATGGPRPVAADGLSLFDCLIV